jgi:hypothetical protein
MVDHESREDLDEPCLTSSTFLIRGIRRIRGYFPVEIIMDRVAQSNRVVPANGAS